MSRDLFQRFYITLSELIKISARLMPIKRIIDEVYEREAKIHISNAQNYP